jgi:polar amino acid transport system substrate-binding protein
MTDRLRRRVLAATALLPWAGLAAADTLEKTRARGVLRFALYDDFAPYSDEAGGIDIDIARAVAEHLGVRADITLFDAGEDMRDDLRNWLWKGGYMGNVVCDVMLHVPVDQVLAEAAPQVRIFSPYHLEQIAVMRDAEHVPPILGLDQFTRVKIGVETGSLADDYLLSALGGRFRNNVVHHRSMADAVRALRDGEVQIVMGSRAHMEAALGDASPRYPVTRFTGAGLNVREWPIGIATRREDADLAAVIEQAMTSLRRDGTLDRVFAQRGVRRLESGADPD